MALPALVARPKPVGWALPDGFTTKIAFQNLDGGGAANAVQFWEKTVQPLGFEGGDPINMNTMFNVLYYTLHPRFLTQTPPIKVTASWLPVAYAAILNMINYNTSVNVHLPNGDVIGFYGYLKNFIPQENKEGEQPMAAIEVVCTNFDCINTLEQGPVYTAGPGTSGFTYCT